MSASEDAVMAGQPKRPWIVRRRDYHYRSERWGRWYTHATYAEKYAAVAVVKYLTMNDSCWRRQAYARHRDALLPVRMDDAKHAEAL